MALMWLPSSAVPRIFAVSQTIVTLTSANPPCRSTTGPFARTQASAPTGSTEFSISAKSRSSRRAAHFDDIIRAGLNFRVWELLFLKGERVERRLAAVLSADVAGYSRLMGADEVGTLQALKAHRRELDPGIAEHKGRIVKTTGDGMLVEFASVVDAVTCAVVVQEEMAERNKATEPKISFRIGINIGDIIIDGDDIFGDGVNVAARIASECEPGAVCLSGSAFDQVRGKTDCEFDDLGEKVLKNIERPVRLYALRQSETRARSAAERKQRSSLIF
jgi:class 3 adenylate cyclase